MITIRSRVMAFKAALSQFIIYACPTGALAKHLEQYFEKSLASCGANAAHRYMPHCTLTGFFHDVESSIPHYVQALALAFNHAQSTRPASPIQITSLAYRDDWHGLELESEWLKAFIADFAYAADSPTRLDSLRLKSWLHLSLAYEFDPLQAAQLQHLAHSILDITADVKWELRFYQRIKEFDGVGIGEGDGEERRERGDGDVCYGGDRWRCHYSWRL